MNLSRAIDTTDQVVSIKTILENAIMSGKTVDHKKIEDQLTDELGHELAHLIIEDWPEADNQVEDYLKAKILTLEKLSKVELVMAFRPAPKTLAKIANWLKDEVGDAAIIKVKFDPRLLGGAQIIYQGKYQDQSLLAWQEQN